MSKNERYDIIIKIQFQVFEEQDEKQFFDRVEYDLKRGLEDTMNEMGYGNGKVYEFRVLKMKK